MHLCLTLCAIFLGGTTVAHSSVKQDTGVITVSVGENVTIHCYYDALVAMHFSWYRQTLGVNPVVLSTVYKFDKPSKMLVWLEKHPRLAVQRQEGQNHLHISNVQPEDSASYFCGSSHSNIVEFGQGVFVNVQEANSKQVSQEPVYSLADPGSSVTMNCTVKPGACSENQSVYWFKHGSRHGIFHTNQCKRFPKSESQSCVYNLQKSNISWSDAGTYYCAVASCGEVLFGNGTVIQVSSDYRDPHEQIQVLVWLSIIRTGALFVLVIVCVLTYFIRHS